MEREPYCPIMEHSLDLYYVFKYDRSTLKKKTTYTGNKLLKSI